MSSKKTTWIRCKNSAQFGIIDFFLIADGKEYYICSQKFRQGSWAYFSNGVEYEKAIDFGRANNDHSVMNAMKRIRSGIVYLEKYENVSIPEKNRRSTSYNKEAV